MRVKLNVEEDEELRQYIKDLIKGQVLSIAREEIVKIIQEVFEVRFGTKRIAIDDIVKEDIKSRVNAQLGHSNYGQPSGLQKIAREVIEKEVKELFKNKVLG